MCEYAHTCTSVHMVSKGADWGASYGCSVRMAA